MRRVRPLGGIKRLTDDEDNIVSYCSKKTRGLLGGVLACALHRVRYRRVDVPRVDRCRSSHHRFFMPVIVATTGVAHR